jgi:wyosine [tRNA(Phe)-imidazoG37] synthetase (radical SAM superfamily)
LASSIVYGPVPSRRLGHSMGINNIPPKICSYSCIYCQLAKTLKAEVDPRSFYKTDRIMKEARIKLDQIREQGKSIDYATFVPDGEPTLDANIGEEICALKGLGVRVAVITNGSLLWREDVRQSLSKADWVSLKVDTINEDTWLRIDQPHKSLKLATILEGMHNFARTFAGELTTETMLVKGVNDNLVEIKRIAEFLTVLKPARDYIAIPIRPPAERVEPANEQTVNAAYQVFEEKLGKAEYLIGYEGNAFACTGDIREDLLSITAVHPMREDAVLEFLENAGTDWGTVQELINSGLILETEYQGKKFYMRRLPGSSRSQR